MTPLSKRFISKLLRVFVSVVAFTFLNNCASISTNGANKITEVSSFFPNEKAKVTFRAYSLIRQKFDNTKKIRTTILNSPDLIAGVKSILETSKNFQSIQVKTFSSNQINITEESSAFSEKLLAVPPADLDSDYFIDVYTLRQRDFSEFKIGNFATVLTVVSLGLLPTYRSNEIQVVMSIYDRQGRLITSLTSEDAANIWIWTPLILLPSVHAMKEPEKTLEPVFLNNVRILLNKALSQKVFNAREK